ncbi:hypothetical protein B0H13DRAFT_1947689, partial [Mycena leptocephala]
MVSAVCWFLYILSFVYLRLINPLPAPTVMNYDDNVVSGPLEEAPAATVSSVSNRSIPDMSGLPQRRTSWVMPL